AHHDHVQRLSDLGLPPPDHPSGGLRESLTRNTPPLGILDNAQGNTFFFTIPRQQLALGISLKNAQPTCTKPIEHSSPVVSI
ncbi:MAG: hypothetical protein AB7T01_07825, partial [Acidithiobacillus sp.]